MVQIQDFQLRKRVQTGDGGEGAAGKIQGFQVSQRYQHIPIGIADTAAGHGQIFQGFHSAHLRQNTGRRIFHYQGFQPGQMRQICKGCSFCGKCEFLDVPKIAGVNGGRAAGVDHLPYGIFNSLVGKCNRFHNAAYGIAEHSQGADQTVIANTKTVQHGIAKTQGNGRFIPVSYDGGILLFCADIGRAIVAEHFHADILGVETGLIRNCGGQRPLGFQGCPDLRIMNGIEHIYGIQQLILLNIQLAQGDIQIRGRVFGNGFRKGVFSFGVVAVLAVLLRKLNGNGILLAGLGISQVIHPGGSFLVTALFQRTGTPKDHILGQLPIIYQKVPGGGSQHCKHKHQRYNYAQGFFH